MVGWEEIALLGGTARGRKRREGGKEGADKSSLLLPRLHDVFSSPLSPCYIPPTAIVNELMRAEGEREREWREVFVEAALKKIVVLLLSGGED